MLSMLLRCFHTDDSQPCPFAWTTAGKRMGLMASWQQFAMHNDYKLGDCLRSGDLRNRPACRRGAIIFPRGNPGEGPRCYGDPDELYAVTAIGI